MAKIDNYTLQRIKDTAKIQDVVADFITLRIMGVRYTGICPFHDDHHEGNFIVFPKENCYKCFACDAKGGPVDFLMKAQGMTFPEAIRWLGRKYRITVEDKHVSIPPTPQKAEPQPKELCTIPKELVTNSLDLTFGSNFQASLCRMFNNSKRIQDVCLAYALGMTKNGSTIWWQIDEKGKVRTGKIMQYDFYGHRDRSRDEGRTTWVHSLLKKQGKLPQDWELTQCLFGAHLLHPTYHNEGKVIGLVESEKSAIICSLVFPQLVWMACGGMSNLTAGDKHLLLKGRKVIMFPDTDPTGEAYGNWKAKADEWNANGFTISVSDLLERNATDEQKAKKIDIADWLEIDLRKKYIPSPIEEPNDILTEMMKNNPALRLLVEKLDLEEAA